MKVPICQEDEFKWRNRAFEGQFHDAEHQLAPFPGAQMLGQGRCPFKCVKLMDALAPFRFSQSRRFTWSGVGAGGNDQEVVFQDSISFRNMHTIVIGIDALDPGNNQLYPRRNEVSFRLYDVVFPIDAKRNKQETGLVVVGLMLVNQRDLPLFAAKDVTQPVCYHSAGSAGAENQYSLHQ